jgi:proteic killer suppression protein
MRAKRLGSRIKELRAEENVTKLRYGNPHPLTGDRAGQFSVDLDGLMRFLFEPIDQPPPTLPSGGHRLATGLQRLHSEIEDTHG